MAIGSGTSGSHTSDSQASDDARGWAKWILPSATDLIFVALFALLACTSLSTRLLSDAGIGWHIRTGQSIAQTHAIPRVDPFSSSMNGQPWFAWEWLYDLIAGALDSAFGLNGVVLLGALLIAATFAGTFRLLLKRGTSLPVAVVLTLLAVSAAMIHFQARPHVVSWLLTILWFWILDSTEYGEVATGSNTKSRRLWILPLLMLAWVNLHGGFLVGFVLLAIYWLSAMVAWCFPKQDSFEHTIDAIRAGARARTLGAVAIVCAAATFVNPYGAGLHVHIYRYLSNRFLMDHIDEFQSPNFHYAAQKCFAVLLLLALWALAIRGRRVPLREGLLVAFAVCSGLFASRNIPVASLLLILIIGPWLSDAAERFSARRSSSHATNSFWKRMDTIELGLRGHLWPIAAVALAFAIAANGGNVHGEQVMNAHFDAKRFPAAAIDYLTANSVPGPVLSTDYWGGYLIYRTYPKTQVVVDDRHDFYGEAFLRSYLKMIHVEPGWQNFLQEHDSGCLLLPKGSALANIVSATNDWKEIYHDDVAVAFVRATSSNAISAHATATNP